MRKGEKVKESCRGGQAESFGTNFIDQSQSTLHELY